MKQESPPAMGVAFLTAAFNGMGSCLASTVVELEATQRAAVVEAVKQ